MTAAGLRSIPPWRLIVLVVAATGASAIGLAAAVVALDGLTDPALAGACLVATAAVNRIYVLVARRGQVLEGIDLAEAAIVALALLLPPAEALLTFVVASFAMELPIDRAPIKKVFNVGIRATGAGVLLIPVSFVGGSTATPPARFTAVALGAVCYTVVNAIAVAAVIATVQQRRMTRSLTDGLGARAVVATAAIVTGLCAGYTAQHRPLVLAGVAALLSVVVLTARTARRAQLDRDRLHHLLDATTRIQSAHDPAEQEAVLVEAARELLLWRDVTVRDGGPLPGEAGAPLFARGGQERWLIASPQPDSDPWNEEDGQILHALASAAIVAMDRIRLQVELARQARHDPLTGLLNRRGFDEQVAALPPGARFSIALIDLDGFKSVNDRLGHDAGDDLLRIAAARLSAAVRTSDVVARMGGDEFVVLLRDVGARGAQTVTRKMSSRLAQPVRLGRWVLSCIPASVGVATTSYELPGARAVLQAADEHMYDVKRRRAATALQEFTVSLPAHAGEPAETGIAIPHAREHVAAAQLS